MSRGKRLRLIGFWSLVVLLPTGLIVWFVWHSILPYSSRYNPHGLLSTNPNGLGQTGAGTTRTKDAQPVPTAVRLVPISSRMTASSGFGTAIQLRLEILDASGQVMTQGAATTVTLQTASPTGEFAGGPAAFLAAGRPLLVSYRDTTAGTVQLSAFVSGLNGSTTTVIIDAGAPVSISDISPAQPHPAVGTDQFYGVTLGDRYGNATTGATVHWSLATITGSAVPLESDVPADASGTSRLLYRQPSSAAGSSQRLVASFAGVLKSLLIYPK